MKRMNFVWGVLIAAFVLLLSACRSTKNKENYYITIF